MDKMKDCIQKLAKNFNFEIMDEAELHYSIILENPKDILLLVEEAKLSHKFRMLIDICGVDYPANIKRFEVVYQLLNLEDNFRLTIKAQIAENDSVPSIVRVHSGACWFERETFDMYGIPFSDAVDLRRILTDYNFEGFPLRKDFPLTGFIELQYDPIKREIVRKPVNLSQEYRNFDFESPWETCQYQIKKA